MKDIFISYKREDKKNAQLLADKLEDSGWSVWWDHDLLGGEDYDVTIEKELKAAKCVIVIWSPLSVQSRNVKDEAKNAINRNVLVPVTFDNTEPPIGFGMTHVVFFKHKYKISDEEYKKLYESVLQKIKPGETSLPIISNSPSFIKKYKYYILGFLIIAFTYSGYHYFIRPNIFETLASETDTSKNATNNNGTSIINNDSLKQDPGNSSNSIDTNKKKPAEEKPAENNSTVVPAKNLQVEAEQLTNDFINAIKTKDVENIIVISSTPFYFDNKVLTTTEEIRASFQMMMQAKGGQSFPEIKSIKVKKVSEWKKEDHFLNDRILKNMSINDDDYYAGIIFDKDGLGVAFRLVNNKLKIAGLWD